MVSGVYLLSSCASILNGKYQRVQIFTNSNNSEIYVDNKLAGKGKHAEAKVKRDLKAHPVRIETPGYKPENDVLFQTKKSPLLIMSWIPFSALMLVPPLYDRGPKSWNYEKEYSLNTKVKISTREENQKYIYLKNTSFDVPKEDFKIEYYSHRRYKNNKNSKNTRNSDKEIDITNSIFTDALNDILKKNGFVDTTQKVLRNKTNTMYVNAKVTSIKLSGIAPKIILYGYDYYYTVETVVKWELLDVYEQVRYSTQVTSSSGKFVAHKENQFLIDAMDDALQASFFKFLSDPEIKNMLQVDVSKNESLTPIKITAPAVQASLKRAQTATVTIVSKKGHGSGCIISKDGYIVTNYHVIAGTETQFDVILNSGDKLKAKLVRGNEYGDLALLLLDTPPADLGYFNLPTEKNFDVGDEVFAIGTPTSVELSQTLTKGIISAYRKLPDNEYLIQTDVAVNAGNSGGALITKDGQLVGVINSKLIGFGVEGISFCIPATKVAKVLGIQ